jgi:hypothetical protein
MRRELLRISRRTLVGTESGTHRSPRQDIAIIQASEPVRHNCFSHFRVLQTIVSEMVSVWRRKRQKEK